MYISPPPGVTAKMLDCKITASRLTLGIKGNPPFIDVGHKPCHVPPLLSRDVW